MTFGKSVDLSGSQATHLEGEIILVLTLEAVKIGYCMFSAQDSVCEQPNPLALNLKKGHNVINV